MSLVSDILTDIGCCRGMLVQQFKFSQLILNVIYFVLETCNMQTVTWPVFTFLPSNIGTCKYSPETGTNVMLKQEPYKCKEKMYIKL
jgi:hypothetical protein